MENNNQEESLDLSFYFEALLKHWRLIAFVAFVGVLAAVLVNMLMQPRFKASVLMMIDRENSGKIEQVSFGSWTSDEDYYRTQYQLLETRTLLEKVYNDLNLAEVPEFAKGWKSLKNALKIEPVTRSRLVNLTISSYDPKLSAQIANYLAKAFTEQNIKNRLSMATEVLTALETTEQSPAQKELLNSLPQIINSDFIKGLKREEMETSSQLSLLLGKYTDNHPEVIAVSKKLDNIQKTIERETKRLLLSIKIDLSGQFSANNIRIVDEAVVPLRPYQPRKLLNIAIGLFAGILLGVLITFLLEFLDQTTKTAKDIEDKFKIPLLGFIPHEKQKKDFDDYRIMLKEGNILTAENIRWTKDLRKKRMPNGFLKLF